jgi:hypothetical protein
MCRFLRIFLLVLGALASFSAAACHRVSPNPKALDGYSVIFLGTITGIHLDGYEAKLLGKPDKSFAGQTLTITNGSSPVSVTAVPTELFRRTAKAPAVLQLVGCTIALPALKERGLFFVKSDGVSAITVWESSPQEFAHWLNQLGVQPDGR